jgi:hypothetical protein
MSFGSLLSRFAFQIKADVFSDTVFINELNFDMSGFSDNRLDDGMFRKAIIVPHADKIQTHSVDSDCVVIVHQSTMCMKSQARATRSASSSRTVRFQRFAQSMHSAKEAHVSLINKKDFFGRREGLQFDDSD